MLHVDNGYYANVKKIKMFFMCWQGTISKIDGYKKKSKVSSMCL
jgi:hypothetical protein